ncbi:MAG: PAS domain-containing sensor histidine kinase [Mesorhizobium sp.]|nr:MAG: PAS domain-containing sensor histidine kinase [Mesorhizobium sp.]RWB95421.1 MAG: PAS domain-containing sensor histidine kinase [Mesorhizobium sp.]RWG81086.1 MAG: PAS domain-containing sensor histidine kinase [Mesorhizobium sp.]RWK15173.1 MAG: PAS domain-containing sensor histidine kinase [Mesorhizobium sp.]
MGLTSMTQRRAVAAAIGAGSALLAFFAGEPSGLLVTIAVICICVGWKTGLAAIAAASLFSAVMLPAYGAENGAVRLLAFVAAALGLWLVVNIFRRMSFFDRVYRGAGPSIADIPGFGWSANADGRLRVLNAAALEYVGITVEEMREIMDADDSWWLRFVHPDDVETTVAKWRHSLQTGEPMIEEQRLRRVDGTYRWFRETGVASRDERGRIVGWYGHAEDIDDRRKAEAALRQSERELRLLVDTVPTMIWLMTPAGLPYYFNKRFVDWAGIDSTKVEPRGTRQFASHVELFHPDDRAAVKAVFQKSFARGEPLQHKGRLCRKDGEYRWIDSRFEPLRDEDGAILRWYGVNFDIDDEVRAQESLRLADERLARALRAASLSELSVSIAHELNQPLQAVVSNAGAFQRWLNTDPPNFDHASRVAQKIIKNADAAAQVISRIRALFSKTEGEPHAIDLNSVIREVCDLLGDGLASSSVKLDLQLDPHLPAVAADRVQMEQVVLNLVRNGIEAMQDVATSMRSLLIVSRHQNDGTVEVEVRDRGRGLSNPEMIFEAFYTTKPDGMGMGLAICRSIVEAHCGRLWAENVETGGASITFSLPISATHSANTPDAATVIAGLGAFRG